MHTGRADHVHDALLPRLLHSVTRSVSRHPRGSLGIVLLLTLVSLGISARFLGFKTNRSDLIDANSPFHQRWLRYTERFGDESDVLVVVEAPTGSETRQVLDELGAALATEDELFSRILHRIDIDEFKPKALQFLSPRELETGLARLETYAPILEGHWDRAGLESYARRLTRLLDHPPIDGAAADRTGQLQAVRFCESLGSFDGAASGFRSPWPSILVADADSRQLNWEPAGASER